MSCAPDHGADAAVLIKNAAVALSHAKKQGGGSHQMYSSGIHRNALKTLTLETELRHALEREEIELFYQPKIDMNASTVVGMEALARWNHRELGLVPPSDFIPLAEETGLIIPIGEWILRKACVETKAWEEKGFELNVAVNLSPRQLQQTRIAERIEAIVMESGLQPCRVDLEVTESSLMNSADAAKSILGGLREIGIRISLDDFVTGYSSLVYLKLLPIDVLKIDRSFVQDVTRDPDDAALVMAVITLAHNLRLKVVAEGVEAKEQLRLLHLLRCDEWQGYLASKPLPAAMFENYLNNYPSQPQAVIDAFAAR
jgi:EAL domain-containing protein (putative c-di-GMP-specific phosphodiesterase class I)